MGLKTPKVILNIKNKVIGFPSSVGIVLVKRNDGGKIDTILFLEPKFSEYFLEIGKGEVGDEYAKHKNFDFIDSNSNCESLNPLQLLSNKGEPFIKNHKGRTKRF